jgi:molecular chaperone GrpE
MPEDVENTEQAAEPEQVELEALRAENEELIDTLQRVQAEFDNYRKRAARDQDALVARAGERIVKELLPVLDDLERVLEAAQRPEAPVRDSGPREGVRGNRVEVPPTNRDVSNLANLEEGVKLVHRHLEQLLEREGLAPVETDGKFDPHVHEALLTQPSAAEEGSVIEVLQKGYRLGDRVLRPARVVVAGPKEPHGDAA